MPWTTPTLRAVREMVRGEIVSKLAGATFIGNSVLRVMADAKAALAHLVLKYIDWLARQLLPDTAETEWLDRHGDIWLRNADGTLGRKLATLSRGSAVITGIGGAQLPQGTRLRSVVNIEYETDETVFVGSAGETVVAIVALDPGAAGNLAPGSALVFPEPVADIDTSAVVQVLEGGTDEESDEELRLRVLTRIRQPPMGGAAHDYVQWALSVPGVTRAWCGPLEMGIGTVTVRFMMDDLRADRDGFPTAEDVGNVEAYIDTVRPVAVKDRFIVAPARFPLNFKVTDLADNTQSVRQGIADAVEEMLRAKAAPGQTIYRSWMSEAVSSALGEEHHELDFVTTLMPSVGHLAVLGTVEFE